MEPRSNTEGDNGTIMKPQQFLVAQVSSAGSVPTQTLLVRPSFAIPYQGNAKVTTILTVLKSVDSSQATVATIPRTPGTPGKNNIERYIGFETEYSVML